MIQPRKAIQKTRNDIIQKKKALDSDIRKDKNLMDEMKVEAKKSKELVEKLLKDNFSKIWRDEMPWVREVEFILNNYEKIENWRKRVDDKREEFWLFINGKLEDLNNLIDDDSIKEEPVKDKNTLMEVNLLLPLHKKLIDYYAKDHSGAFHKRIIAYKAAKTDEEKEIIDKWWAKYKDYKYDKELFMRKITQSLSRYNSLHESLIGEETNTPDESEKGSGSKINSTPNEEEEKKT